MAERSSEDPDGQRIVRVPGSRRARLTPVPGTDPNPEPVIRETPAPSDPATTKAADRGPNDERLRLDVPPHY